ncbi:MAG: hypothetical protein O3A51_02030 [Verrucomicrobia bacterium]|nr:hypothetical protein [Verrucomicrobiota bacterium]
MGTTLAVALGIALIGLWIAFLFESRNEMNRHEYLSPSFIFQWNILPLVVALELIATHNLAVLALGLLVFFLCWPFAKILMIVVPTLAGWHVGMQWSSRLFQHSEQQAMLGALIVAIVVTIVCHGAVAAVRVKPRNA